MLSFKQLVHSRGHFLGQLLQAQVQQAIGSSGDSEDFPIENCFQLLSYNCSKFQGVYWITYTAYVCSQVPTAIA